MFVCPREQPNVRADRCNAIGNDRGVVDVARGIPGVSDDRDIIGVREISGRDRPGLSVAPWGVTATIAS